MSLLGEFQKRVLPVQHKLYRFALRMLGNTEEAEDVVQEVLLRIWDSRKEMHHYANMEAWCMRMAKNLSLDRLKGARYRLNQDLDHAQKKHGCEMTPDQQAELQDTLGRVHKLIEALPEKQKMVIQLRDIEAYSYQEIADIMEISLDQVKVNLFRARKHIRKQLQLTESYGL